MDEAGLPGFSATSWQRLFAPAGTPADIQARLHTTVAAAMTAPEIRDSFAAQGFKAEATKPAEFDAFVKAEVTEWAAVVQDGGVRLD